MQKVECVYTLFGFYGDIISRLHAIYKQSKDVRSLFRGNFHTKSLVKVATDINGVYACMAYCHSCADSIFSTLFAPLILRNIIREGFRVKSRRGW